MLTAWLYWPGHAAARTQNGGETCVEFGDATMAVRLVDEPARLHVLRTDALAQLDAIESWG
jgi:hypothetical protein